MYQSLNFLQMGSEELEEYLNELSMENPVLESEPPKKAAESRYVSMQSGYVKKHSGEVLDLPIPDRSGFTLQDYLNSQLITMKLTPEMDEAVRFLTVNIDDKGYLPKETLNCRKCRENEKLYEEALAIIQNLEPAGIAASNLKESLCIQLERLGEKDSSAYLICRDYLEHLARDHINHISKALGISESDVCEARKLISTLNPYPANGFDDGRNTVNVFPDVIVEIEDGEIVLYSSEDYCPSYRVNSQYAAMASDPDLSDEEREYFKEKLDQAKWAVSCVEHRKKTLLSCVEAIVNEQWEFFSGESGAIRPCTMSDIANEIGVHVSTVSRTARDKYISCSKGVFPMSAFFAQEVSGDTSDEIIKVIKKIISREDADHPLSDAAICDELKRRGYDIARRTIAKYREKAMIPSATGRKRRM